MPRVFDGGLYVVVAVLLLAAVGACSKPEPVVPLCPNVRVQALMTSRGVFYVLGQDNMESLVAVMKGLRERTCRVVGVSLAGQVDG